jgi:hypothetical protein
LLKQSNEQLKKSLSELSQDKHSVHNIA